MLRSQIPYGPEPLHLLPAYNDAGTIASLALIAHMTARQLTSDYEVIVIDDGSPDHTGELLDEMARHFPWLKVVHHGTNRGLRGGAAHRASRPRPRTSSSTRTATPNTTRGR
jgi:cellulose synthase/poly-beta-1,6-N-acetylglucosamine synthase-like glycosyltransferase